MAGCAMIGQSVINVKSGGRGRLSTFAAGLFLLLLMVFSSEWVQRIPMAALVAVMIMVSIGTFNWDSLRKLRVHPKSSSIVMIVTVCVVVFTHDLAKGVLAGVLLSGIFFARKVGQVLHVGSESVDEGAARHYTVTGQVFFASTEKFIAELRPGAADTVIHQYVTSNAIDLLVMGAYGHSRIRQLVIGSTTAAMVRICLIPVLLLR